MNIKRAQVQIIFKNHILENTENLADRKEFSVTTYFLKFA